MKQKLQEYALLAEIISGVAVLVTLIFLIVSIREDTNATRTLVYEELLSGVNEFNNVIMQDDQLTNLWLTRRTLPIKDLSGTEIQKLTLMMRTNMRIFDAAFSASQYETIGQSEAERMLQSACNTYRTVVRANAELEPDIYIPISEEFRDYLRDNC